MLRLPSSRFLVRDENVCVREKFGEWIPCFNCPDGILAPIPHMSMARPYTQQQRPSKTREDFDILLAADCLYTSRDFDSFFATVAFLLERRPGPPCCEGGRAPAAQCGDGKEDGALVDASRRQPARSLLTVFQERGPCACMPCQSCCRITVQVILLVAPP